MRRVCFFGGPGTGKSTLAMGLASRLKARGMTAEYVHEFVKGWAYQEIPIKGFDQVYLFASQMRIEEVVIRSAPDMLVVSDSPLLLYVAYTIKYGVECWRSLLEIAMHYERRYPALNILVRRDDLEYAQSGRYEDAGEALDMDRTTRRVLDEAGVPFTEEFCYRDLDAIEEAVLKGPSAKP
jgi:nicotinamide riboside kinase